MVSMGRLDTPESIVQWFQSFEGTDGSPLEDLGAWQLVSVYDGCGDRRGSNATGSMDEQVCVAEGSAGSSFSAPSPITKTATSDSFRVTCSDEALVGSCALQADSVAHDGGAMQLSLADQLPGTAKAMLRGYFRDECGHPHGSHWMSPNFQACPDGGADVRFLLRACFAPSV